MTTIMVELQVRLEELVEDNTEMAGQLREIAMTGRQMKLTPSSKIIS